MTVKVKSHAKRIKAKIRNENKRRLRESARVVKERAKALLSTPGTGRATKRGIVRTKTARGKNTIVGAFRSRAGESPFRQTGQLLKSVKQLLMGSTKSRVFTDMFYGRILDSPRYKPGRRPWLKKALDDMSSTIKNILTQKMDLT